jgi:BolA protein
MSSTTAPGPVESSIRQKLTELLKPAVLEIQNDSAEHRGHASMRAIGGGNGETHFTVSIVSDEFVGKPTIKRHRIIYEALAQEFAEGLHALSLITKTPAEISKSST